MNRVGVIVLLCGLAASSCSKKCQDISSDNFSTTLAIRAHADLVLAKFSDEINFTGTAPEGMALTNNEGQLVLSGTPTRTGAFTFTITPKTLSCLEYPNAPSAVTEFSISVTVAGAECANGELPPQTAAPCLGSTCDSSQEVCNEGGHSLVTTFPARSLVRFGLQGDGHSRVTLRQYSAWFESISQGTTPPFELLRVTPAAGEVLSGWFFTHDLRGAISMLPELEIENLDAVHASTVTFDYSITGFEPAGALSSAGTLNTPLSFSAPASPLFVSDLSSTWNFQFSLAEPAFAWELAVLEGCEHPAMTGAQSYTFLSDLDVGLWSLTSAAVDVGTNYRVSVRSADGGVLADGAATPLTFSVHETQRVNLEVTPLQQDGGALVFSSTCAFDGGSPPAVEWGGPRRIALERLSPDAG